MCCRSASSFLSRQLLLPPNVPSILQAHAAARSSRIRQQEPDPGPSDMLVQDTTHLPASLHFLPASLIPRRNSRPFVFSVCSVFCRQALLLSLLARGRRRDTVAPIIWWGKGSLQETVATVCSQPAHFIAGKRCCPICSQEAARKGPWTR